MKLLLSSVALRAFGNTVPVVVIKTENGPVRINLSDYDPAIHTLVDGEEAPVPAPAPVVEPLAPVAQPVNEAPAPVAATDAAPVPPAPVPAPPPAPVAPVYLVTPLDKKTKRHFIVDSANNRIVNDKIDATGYATEKEAWDAVLTL